MGQGQSLLALTVIKAAQHECRHQGCDMMLEFNQIKEHEEKCAWRLVRCPGSGHPVYFWPKLTSRLVEGSHQVAIFQIVLVVAIKRSQGDPGSAKSMQTDILTH